MLKIYGIKNCDTMKKAFTFLDKKGIGYSFHDYKKEGISEETIQGWLKKLPLDQVINKKGTTWKTLSEEQQAVAENQEGAIVLMMEKPSLIKRPLVQIGNEFWLGFNEEEWLARL